MQLKPDLKPNSPGKCAVRIPPGHFHGGCPSRDSRASSGHAPSAGWRAQARVAWTHSAARRRALGRECWGRRTPPKQAQRDTVGTRTQDAAARRAGCHGNVVSQAPIGGAACNLLSGSCMLTAGAECAAVGRDFLFGLCCACVSRSGLHAARLQLWPRPGFGQSC